MILFRVQDSVLEVQGPLELGEGDTSLFPDERKNEPSVQVLQEPFPRKGGVERNHKSQGKKCPSRILQWSFDEQEQRNSEKEWYLGPRSFQFTNC